uniref:HMG box domain-containing protein n=1 Tax=Panagrolaimus sp. ES5 TaxID=591445 RepID=A0AC34GNA2_9BILA
MFRAIGKFRYGALIQSNVICRNFASLPPLFADKPWILFLRKEKGNVFDLSGVESQLLSNEWKALSKEEKQFFCDQSKEIWKKVPAEFSDLPESEQQDILDEQKKLIEESKIRRQEIRQFFKDTNVPLPPVRQSLMYCKEKYPEKQGKDADEEFGKLSDEEKQPYNDKYKEERKIYSEECKRWKVLHGKTFDEIKKKY